MAGRSKDGQWEDGRVAAVRLELPVPSVLAPVRPVPAAEFWRPAVHYAGRPRVTSSALRLAARHAAPPHAPGPAVPAHDPAPETCDAIPAGGPGCARPRAAGAAAGSALVRVAPAVDVPPPEAEPLRPAADGAPPVARTRALPQAPFGGALPLF